MNDDIHFTGDGDQQEGTEPPSHPVSARMLDDAQVVQAQVVGQSAADRPPPELPHSRSGWVVASWIVVTCVATFLVVAPMILGPVAEEDSEPLDNLGMLELQGQYMVGLYYLSAAEETTSQQLYAQAELLNSGTFENRLCFVVLSGEFKGASNALQDLAKVVEAADEYGYEQTPEERELVGILKSVYEDYEGKRWHAPSIDQARRDQLRDELGWYGNLALTPSAGPDEERRDELVNSAKFTVYTVIGLFMLIFGSGGAGVVLLVVFGVQVYRRRIRSHLATKTPNGAIYLETFAIWLTTFVALSIVMPLAFPTLGIMALNLLVVGLSMSAVTWPLIRSIPAGQVCQEIGLFARRPWLEVFWGLVGYIATIPLLGMALMVMLMLMVAAGIGAPVDQYAVPQGPSHPIVEWLAEADLLTITLILLIAAVLAPITEEILFRGFLYRHLRDLSARRRLAISILIATLVNSFVFAIIHPQGIIAVPVLMTLAIAFSLMREWRGSLLAPMTMHAVNNFCVTVLGIVVMS